MNLLDEAKPQREWVWLGIILSIGLALRITAIVEFRHEPESDELAYKSIALNVVGGKGIIDSMGNHAMYNVGYPLLVLSPVFFFLGDNVFVARLVHIVLGGGTIILCYLVAREAGAGRLGRLMAAAIWAVYLPASVYVVYLLKENLMTPLMLGLVWCALKLARKPSKGVAVGCGALIGLLALTGNAGLSLVAVVGLALVLMPATLAERVTVAILVLLMSSAICGPWLVRNMQVLGAPVLNTNGGFNLYLGNNPAATGMFVSIAETPLGSSWEALRKTGEVHASEILKQEAIAWIKTHPTEFATLALKKAAYFWTPPFHGGKSEQSSVEKVVRLAWAIQFLILVAAALSTLLIRKMRNKRTVILWLAVACYTAVHMLFYVIFRYREPIMPVVGILAALAMEFFYFRASFAVQQFAAAYGARRRHRW